MPSYVLYKLPVSLDTLAVVQYLHAHGVPGAVPRACVERSHPPHVAHNLPAILVDDDWHVGLDACLRFWAALEQKKEDAPLLCRALEWKRRNSDFRIHR